MSIHRRKIGAVMRSTYDKDDSEDDLEEGEDAESDGDNFDDASPTTDCPYCGEVISEHAVQCPHCHSYLSVEDTARERRPLWVIIGFVLVGLILLTWIFHGSVTH